MADRSPRRERTTSGTKRRIDSAHAPGETAPNSNVSSGTPGYSPQADLDPPDSDALDAAAGFLDAGSSEEQVLTQAAQLAALLNNRQRDLDRREANLNAAAAKFDADSRSLRLAQQERESDLADREQAAQERVQAWEQRAAEEDHRRDALQREMNNREQRLQLWEEQLDERERKLQEEADGLEQSRRCLHADRVQAEEQLQQDRLAFLDERDAERQALVDERARHEEALHAERNSLLHELTITREQHQQRLEEQQVQLIAEIERQRQDLFEQQEQLQNAVAQMEQDRAALMADKTELIADRSETEALARQLAEERSWLEQERAAFGADRAQWSRQQEEMAAALDKKQQEIERLCAALAAQPAKVVEATAPATKNAAQEVFPATIADPVSAKAAEMDPPPMVPLPAVSLLELAEHQSRIDEATAYLEREAEELDRLRLQLAEEQAKLKQRRQEREEEFARREKELEQEIEARKAKIAGREQLLDQQIASVEQTRQEILQVHRESLEMRLVAEELWAQVAGRVPPAEVTQSIAKLRNRLAGQYRAENQHLATKKQQILELSDRLQQQHEALLRQRRELQTWAAARQLEIEQQAERLVKRELELEQQQQTHEQQQRRWEGEIRNLQQEVRRLSQDRDERCVAAA